jgi:hypothetical protein
MKIGDKVMVPLKKTIGVSWKQSAVILKALVAQQDYLYIVNVSEDKKSVELHINPDTDMGEFFMVADVEPYKSEKKLSHLIQHLRLIKNENKKEKIYLATRRLSKIASTQAVNPQSKFSF